MLWHNQQSGVHPWCLSLEKKKSKSLSTARNYDGDGASKFWTFHLDESETASDTSLKHSEGSGGAAGHCRQSNMDHMSVHNRDLNENNKQLEKVMEQQESARLKLVTYFGFNVRLMLHRLWSGRPQLLSNWTVSSVRHVDSTASFKGWGIFSFSRLNAYVTQSSLLFVQRAGRRCKHLQDWWPPVAAPWWESESSVILFQVTKQSREKGIAQREKNAGISMGVWETKYLP